MCFQGYHIKPSKTTSIAAWRSRKAPSFGRISGGFSVPYLDWNWFKLRRAMTHDESLFEAPFEFKPERYLELDSASGRWKYVGSKLDPKSVIFGYGRRCKLAHPPLLSKFGIVGYVQGRNSHCKRRSWRLRRVFSYSISNRRRRVAPRL